MKNKRYLKSKEQVNVEKRYSVDEALNLALETAQAGFDESIDVSVKLGVDPKQSDQQVRGAVELPHGSGRSVKILVLAKGEKESEAEKAGADYVGNDDLIEKIQKGWLDFDRVIATPSMMSSVSKAAKVLGPKGLMPNPKLGTVTNDVGEAVRSEKKGKINYRVEKAGIVHVMVGKKSMGSEKLKENFLSFMSHIVKAKPSSSKGVYLRGVTVSSTMGPGVKVDVANAQSLL